MVTNRRTIEASVHTATFPNGMAPSLPSQIEVNLASAFREIAQRKSPPVGRGISLNETWAHLRYGAAVDPGATDLRLRQEWSDLDPHEKTILSDDWGVGFAFAILDKPLNISIATSTLYWLAQHKTGSLKTRPKRGTGKSPDFILMDHTGVFHVLECKGNQSSRGALTSAVRIGKDQKANLRFKKGTPTGLSMVSGVFVPQFESAERPLFLLADPKPSDDAVVVDDDADDLAEIVARGELAASLRSADQPVLANAVAHSRVGGSSIDDNTAAILKSERVENGDFVLEVGARTAKQLESIRVRSSVRLSLRVPVELVEECLRGERIATPEKRRQPTSEDADERAVRISALGVRASYELVDIPFD